MLNSQSPSSIITIIMVLDIFNTVVFISCVVSYGARLSAKTMHNVDIKVLATTGLFLG